MQTKLVSFLLLILTILIFLGKSDSAAIATCETDIDCSTSMSCQQQSDGTGLCVMKKATSNFGLRDSFTLILMFFGGALSAVGGVGGSGVFIPTLVFVMGISASVATPLANSAAFGLSVANLIQNVITRHPTIDRPLIDFWAGAMLEPSTLAGTVFGVMCFEVFPTWLIITLLVCVLGFATYRTGQKGAKLWKEESKLNSKQSNDEDSTQQPPNTTIIPPPANLTEPDSTQDQDDNNDKSGLLEWKPEGQSRYSAPNPTTENPPMLTNKDVLAKMIEKERGINWSAVLIQLCSWSISFAFVLLRGGSSKKSIIGASKCDETWWALTFGLVATMALLSFLIAKALTKQHEAKKSLCYPFQKGDIHWTPKNIVKIPGACVIAGLIAGLLGVGGGFVKVPLLLELGVLPQVATATSSYMILFTCSTTVIQYFMAGRLPLDYFFLYASLGFISSIFGQTLMAYLIKKYNKSSLIVFCTFFVACISAICMTTQGIMEVTNGARNDPETLNFSALCPK